ncbi:hypothetical protein [Nostoc sp.]|uniref:hypothetical protein n=1 Tax=Nostoc sp. TaxID=1180 RepID=UPI002FFBA202
MLADSLITLLCRTTSLRDGTRTSRTEGFTLRYLPSAFSRKSNFHRNSPIITPISWLEDVTGL